MNIEKDNTNNEILCICQTYAIAAQRTYYTKMFKN